MDAAASTAPDVHTENGVEHSNAARTLRPLLKAIEMVFGSAAALSATFGYRVSRVLPWHGMASHDLSIILAGRVQLPQTTEHGV